MSYNLLLEETKYYIAAQDGRYDNREFDTAEEAEAARLKLREWSENEYRSTCVRSHTIKKKLLTE